MERFAKPDNSALVAKVHFFRVLPARTRCSERQVFRDITFVDQAAKVPKDPGATDVAPRKNVHCGGEARDRQRCRTDSKVAELGSNHMRAKTVRKSTEIKSSVRDSIRTQLLEGVDDIIKLCRQNEYGDKLRSAQYSFLWNASLADPEALEAAYDQMIEDGGCYDMPIDSNAVFGRILIMAIAPSNPAKAAEVFQTLINIYADPGAADHIKHEILEKL